MQELDDLLPHMRHVLAAERELHEQKMMWSMIEAASAIGCPGHADSLMPTLTATREHFAELQQRLVGALARENLDALGDRLGAVAQCSIDILVRNLYERTADVGFLATDAPLVAYCTLPADEREAAAPALRRRLEAYRATYTVYDDIVVLGPDGQVRLRLDPAGEAGCTGTERWHAEALARPGFVEHFGPSALASGGAPALLYAHRIVDERGAACGVLALRFRIADETERLFAGGQVGDDVAVMLVGADDRVVYSNDAAHVPPGARLRPLEPGGVRLTSFAGREYLAVSCPARPYQAYPGPGWRAQAMVSLLTAFRPAAAGDEQVSLEDGVLRGIRREVDGINRNLRRVVWNGRLMAGGGHDEDRASRISLKAVLHQVTLASARMRERVGEAIGDLHRTSLARMRQRAVETARLAVDLMDRNLYERANDCRWWALSPVLREGLAGGGTEHAAAMGRTLAGIHALYTVYSRLVVFGADGVVRASSRAGDAEAAEGLVGQPLDPRWRDAALALRDPSRYAVSGFEAGPLSDGRPSYVYLAAVRAPGADGAGERPVGGVAIAFDAERELAAMLRDVLGGQRGIAAFVDAGRRVLACTDPAFPPGSRWTLPVEPGVFEHDDAHHALGVAAARGYREFKCSDGYDNGVRAVVVLRLGRIERRRRALFDEVLRSHPPAAGGTRAGVRRELAVFQVGAARYALPVEAVRESCSVDGIVHTRGSGAGALGLIAVPGADARMLPVWCARRLLQLEMPPRDNDGVVLMLFDPHRPGQLLGGLRVDEVHAVLEVEAQQVQPLPEALRQAARWLGAVVRVPSGADSAGRAMLQLVDPALLARELAPAAPRALPAETAPA